MRSDWPGCGRSRDGPDLWVEVFGVCWWQLLFEERTGDGREGLDWAKAVGASGEPRGAVFGQTATWDDGVDGGMILELPAPGMQDTGKAGELRTDEPLVFGEAFAGSGRGVD